MKQLLLFFAVSSILLTTSNGCKDSHNPVNPKDTTNTPQDPCKGYKAKPKGTISLYEYSVNGELLSSRPVTSIQLFSGAIFRVSRKYDKYIWRVGTDSRVFTSDTVYLVFRSELDEPSVAGTKRVRLIGIDTLAPKCDTTDDGRDTMDFEFTVLERGVTPWIGKYSITTSEFPNQTSEFSVRKHYVWKNDLSSNVIMISSFLGCPKETHKKYGSDEFPVYMTQQTTTDMFFFNSYDKYDLERDYACAMVAGVLTLSPDGKKLIGTYWYYDPDFGNRIPINNKTYTITGERLP